MTAHGITALGLHLLSDPALEPFLDHLSGCLTCELPDAGRPGWQEGLCTAGLIAIRGWFQTFSDVNAEPSEASVTSFRQARPAPRLADAGSAFLNGDAS
jgi:hypothetical protein